MTQPKWSTEPRKAKLIQLFIQSGGFCVFGHKNCTIPEHHYSEFTDSLIHDWIADDRLLDRLKWQYEREVMHSLGERRTPITGRFNAISRDIFHDSQPLYYLEALGISGITLKPFVKVKLSSSYMRLHVDLGDSLRTVSKNQKRKALRYGKRSQSIENTITHIVSLAVKDYLKH